MEHPPIDVAVCRDARTSIHEGLKSLAAHVKREPGAIPSIVDGVVADVRAARKRAAELMQQAEADQNERLMLVAQRYDEMIINAQVRLLELGVRSASEEQKAIDRQMHIQAYRESKAPIKQVEATQEASPTELKRLQQRQALLAAAQRQMPRMRDAEFSDRAGPEESEASEESND